MCAYEREIEDLLSNPITPPILIMQEFLTKIHCIQQSILKLDARAAIVKSLYNLCDRIISEIATTLGRQPHAIMTTEQQSHRPDYLFRHRVSCNIGNGIRYRMNFVGLAVRDLDTELLLDGHDHLHGVQGVQVQVVLEVGTGANFFAVDLERKMHVSREATTEEI